MSRHLQYVILDDCPCPKPLYPLLKKLKAETGCRYESLYRGDDVADLLHEHGKHTQRELYETLPPGTANPPDRGTHILLGDGVVGKLHARLPFWKCGIDVDDAHADEVIVDARKRHGWILYRPYGTGVEFHHLNFAKKPARWRLFFEHVFGPKVAKAIPAPKLPEPSRHRPTKLSPNGAKFIAGFEGFSARPYKDAVGVWTIGYGHTSGVNAATRPITPSEGLDLLEKDAAKAATAVRDLVHVALNQHQFDALVSFTFNLGSGALAESTLLKKLNKHDYKGAQAEFGKWVYAGGRVLAGLVRRRKAEAALFGKRD